MELDKLKRNEFKRIIFTGGPNSVYAEVRRFVERKSSGWEFRYWVFAMVRS